VYRKYLNGSRLKPAVLTGFKGVKYFSLVDMEERLIFMDGAKLLLGQTFSVGDDD